MNHLNEHDLIRLHTVRDVLEAIHNCIDSSFVEDEALGKALDLIGEAISLNPNRSSFKF